MRVSDLLARWHFGRLSVLLSAIILSTIGAQGQQKISLAGYWERWVAGQLYDNVLVPSSYRPIGSADLVRVVELPQLKAGQRLLLRFEGIAGNGTLRVNGHREGILGPYAPYVFDITSDVKAGPNRVVMELIDWQVPLGLGPAAAWESSGGIIYDAHAEIRTDPYIENARLSYRLSPDFKSADCTLDVFVRSTGSRDVEVSSDLTREGAGAGHAQQSSKVNAGTTTVSLHWTTDSVNLWSPEHPDLYRLSVTLNSPSGQDKLETDIGFRSLTVQGNKFLLNGRPLVLKGVARHGLYADQGYTLTEEQIERDFRMIKSLGANAVRLVHYPHAPPEIDEAARDGILVTEESGLTWIDFRKAPRSTIETGISNLERVVQRDWNNPAFFAILLANESTPTVEVMKEARQRIKALDPSILVSTPGPSAPDDKLESVKRMFDDANFDFYSAHPYTYDEHHFAEVIKIFGDAKPMVFTEWGGPVGKLPRLLSREVRALGSLVQQGQLAGDFFWEWADMTQYMRDDISMDGSTLAEGVVRADRQVRHDVFSRLAELYRYDIGVPPAASRAPVLLAGARVTASAESKFKPISLQHVAEQQTDEWQALQSASVAYWKENFGDYLRISSGDFWSWDTASLRIGPIPFETSQVEGHTRPLVIMMGKTLEIPVHAEADRVHFLGNVTVPDGYPTRGEAGGKMGSYVIYYADGTKQEIPLRWGLEVTRSNSLSSATRLNPIAILSTPVVEYTRNISYEQYRTFLYTTAVKHKMIDHIVVIVDALPAERPLISLPNQTGSGYAAGETTLLLFAVTAESY